MKAIVVSRLGGPEVLEVSSVPDPSPGAGEILVDVTVAGVNFRDVYERERPGYSPSGEPPFIPGSDGAGRVAALGDGVTDLSVGDRVCWWWAPGSYSERVVVPADQAVPIPDAIDDEIACAVLLQGLTAHALSESAYAVKPGDWVLVHAAAGGVGTLLTQMVKLRGGHVLGTTSTEEKGEIAIQAGADAVIRYADVPDRVREITGGGVAAAYDAIGEETFSDSLRCLATGGTLVGYGSATGNNPLPLDPLRLGRKGLYVTWMLLPTYVATRSELLRRASEIFDWISSGQLSVTIGGRYQLGEAVAAQTALQGRATAGKLILQVA